MNDDTMPAPPSGAERESFCNYTLAEVHAYARSYAAQRVAEEQRRVAILASFAHEIWMDAFERPDLAAEAALRAVKLMSLESVLELSENAKRAGSNS